MISCDLILDGNYLLNRNVFSLNKNNLLFGSLYRSLEMSVANYRKWFPFANIYFVSDSRERSWRKRLSNEYKSTRKKDDSIDWEFVFNTYNEFKENLSNMGVKLMESPSVEGDDWISYLCNKANSIGRSTIIISNDYDIKQIITHNISPLYINIMSNEIYNKQKLFLPKNYQVFMNEINKLGDGDIFSLNDNTEFINLINSFIEKYEVSEIDRLESLIVKVISGDKSDNIASVYTSFKDGRKRGIGDTGAKSILDSYISEFGEIDISDPDLYENIADLICEKKKLSRDLISEIITNIEANMKLIHLDVDYLPIDIIERMNDGFNK